MQFFTSQLESISSKIESLQAQLEELNNQRSQLESDGEEFENAFAKLASLLENHQDNPEILECARDRFNQLLAKPEPEPEPKPQPEPEPEPEPENSVCLYRNPSVFWDSHADSMRMFLYTKEDAIATGKEITVLKWASQYNVSPIDSESFCLTLSGVTSREQADKIFDFWLDDEVEDMSSGGDKPPKSYTQRILERSRGVAKNV